MKLKLGLIGNAIAKSRAPELHVFLGKLHGFEVKYDLFDLFQSTSDSFSTTFDHLQHLGYHGCNVTYPFKQIAMRSVHVCEPSSQLVGATNTVKFSSATRAINTDYSGFIRALTSKLPKAELGSSLILGAGGVGRAVACLPDLEPVAQRPLAPCAGVHPRWRPRERQPGLAELRVPHRPEADTT